MNRKSIEKVQLHSDDDPGRCPHCKALAFSNHFGTIMFDCGTTKQGGNNTQSTRCRAIVRMFEAFQIWNEDNAKT